MRVYYPFPPSDVVLESLQNSLPAGIEVSNGEKMPKSFDVLIEGRPTEKMLDPPDLRAVIVPFAGVPVATLDLLKSRPQISLHNLHHNAADTAEMGMALLLAAAKRLVPLDRKLRANDWTPRYEPSETVRLEGKFALVLGYGQIGRRICRACNALGMGVHATRKNQAEHQMDGDIHVHPSSALGMLLPKASVLVIVLPQNEETTGLIGKEQLDLLPHGAILVNIARAQIVDEEALYLALKSGRLHSAGLDVWYAYPQASGGAVPSYYAVPESATDTPPSRFPFHELDNVVMSPHRAGVSLDTERQRVADLALLLKAAAENRPIPNRVDLRAGY